MLADCQLGPPRLLHVFATFDVGGPQVRTLAICRRHGDRYRHGFVAADGRQGAAELIHDPASPVYGLLRPASTWAQLCAMRTVIRAFRPDLILTYNWGAMLGALAARMTGVPFVHHEEIVPPEERVARLRRRDWLRRWLLPDARVTVCVATGMQRIARERWRVPAGRSLLLANAVDTKYHVPVGKRSSPSPVVVGCVANARPEKNWPRLLRAFARLSAGTAKLLLVGDGPDRRAATALASELGILDRVEMVGSVADPRPYYQIMDVFALPSNDEQHPVALLEAMAHGLPIVATDVGDVRSSLPFAQQDFVLSGMASGGAERGDEAFAFGLRRLVADEHLRSRLGQANRSHVVANFELMDLADRYAELYDRAAAKSVAIGGVA